MNTLKRLYLYELIQKEIDMLSFKTISLVYLIYFYI